ncbi:MAG: amino acid permease [Acidobacteria bacterium]|nr:MAG: amino acid permease [Acidobacteriota bacterium]REK01237.1 MAG: amino acid permease [Acidobacteriota bacterium]REK14193.1 MAG: amino acid permease [Acidobacteriota bacterium]REK44908.1 MAG: amino acid permease [Acidobacteriota bacterium]
MTEQTNGRLDLVRGLGLLAAVSIIVGNVIGTGVFLKARVMTCNVGTPGWVLAAWIGAGLLSLAGALTYAEIAAAKPKAGGEYVYLKDSYGKVTSFLFGWMQMFIAKTGSQAAVSVAFAIFLNDFMGGTLRQVLYAGSIFGYAYELTSLQVVAVMVIVIFTTINCASVSIGGQIATYFTVIKIALVLLVGVGAFLLADGSFANFAASGAGGACEEVANSVKYGAAGFTFLGGFSAAMLGALWGYDGWNNIAMMAGEVKKPQRNIPLALIGGTLTIMILYVFIHIAYFYVLTPEAIASVSVDSSVAQEVAVRFLGAAALSLMTAGLMASSLGTLHTSILSGARVPYAMARDGLMFRGLGRLSEATRVPVGALILQGIWACMLAISGSFDTLTNYVIFGSWIFYTLVGASIFIYRRNYPDMERPYKAFGYPVVPVLFILTASALLINTVLTDTWNSLIGILLILLGLPVYFYLTRIYDGKPEED